MKHFCALITVATFLASALPVAAEKLSLKEISRYFNSFQTASGEFTQINEDGTVSTGKLLIKRPGRVRFEYNPPANALVIANGTSVGIVDRKSNTTPEAYPLHRTPLKLILARKINLDREKMVSGHKADGDLTIVTAQDPNSPEDGSIDLIFTGNPVKLTQWVIHSASGERTTVVLGDLEIGVPLDDEEFIIPGRERNTFDR